MRLFKTKENASYPPEILEYLDYIQDIGDETVPNYQYLIEIFEKGLEKFKNETGPV